MSDDAPEVAAVTGGSAGIGLAICEQLLADGYEVVSLARRACPIEHPKLHSIEVDLIDRAATAEAARELARRFEVTTLVHNAGVIRPALVADVKLDDLDALVELHLGCAIQLVQAALPAMRAQRFGRIVLLSSRAARRPARRAPATRRPRPACSAWRAPGRSSSRPTASPSTSSRPGRSAPTCSTRSSPPAATSERALAAVDSGQAPRRAGRRRARRALLRRPGEQLRHRPGALRLRRHQRRQPDAADAGAGATPDRWRTRTRRRRGAAHRDALVEDDRVHRDLYLSEELFALEQQHFFANTWNYVGHASQVPNAGRLPSRSSSPAGRW